LKYAFDKADLEAFVKFQNATEELFGPLFLGTRRNVELIKSELEIKICLRAREKYLKDR